MKKITFSFLLTLASITFSFAQLGLPVGGGNAVTGAVCTEGQVYTWGLNKQGTGPVGTLGNASTANTVPTPLQVIFPVGVSVQQLGAGSGGYFLALDCANKVWGWGDNSRSQLGLGNTAAQTSPQRVLVEQGSPVDLAGFRDPATGQLQKIVKLFAGNATSLAITDDGRLLSWGSNDCGGCGNTKLGTLGNGTNANANFPTFVIDGRSNTPLENVLDISIGDNLGLALVDDSQSGIGIGTVFSWGTGVNGTLGRKAIGNGNSTTEATESNVARPVQFPTNTAGPSGDGFLGNISQIAVGDVAGFAIDVEGYVWAWGDNGNGGQTGQGAITAPHSDPRRVVKGAATGGGTDGTYLLAQSIAGGNAYAMAVTMDGKPVAWGLNACSANAPGPAATPGNNYACGGNLGNNGVGANQPAPVYIQFGPAATNVHNDVTAVARGDFWGYYIRQDNSVYTWGDNSVGQLGIGGHTTRNVATLFPQIAAGCSRPDPAPDANISPRDTTVCASKLTATSPIVLNAGFVLASPLIDLYEFTWYRVANPASTVATTDTVPGNIVKTGWGTTFSTYNATQEGRYWVRVKYKGTKVPCGGYPPAYDYMTITVFPATFKAGIPATFCENVGKAQVAQLAGANPSAVYTWYPSNTGNSSIGSSIGEAVATLDVTSVNLTGPNKIVYVEETNAAGGLVYPKSSASNVAFDQNCGNNSGTFNNTITALDVKKDLEIDTISVNVKSDLYTLNDAQSATISINIWAEKVGGGADLTNIIGTYSATFSKTRITATQTTYTVLKIPVNKLLSKSNRYFIGPSAVVRTGQGDVNLCAGGTETYPKSDNIDGTYLSIGGTGSGSNSTIEAKQGYIFDIKFSTPQKFCDRIQVTLIPNCPCKQPSLVTIGSNQTITAATGTTPKKVTVCVGTAVDLNGTYTEGSGTATGTMSYVWYKKGTIPGAYTAFTPATNLNAAPKNLTGIVADSGVWYLRVEDYNGTSSISSCYRTDSILVAVKRIPTLTITNPASVCAPGTVSISAAGVATDTKKSNATLTYHTLTPATAGNAMTAASAAAITTSGTYYIKATNGICTDEKPVTVTINPVPTFTVAAIAAQCGGSVNLSTKVTGLNPSSAALTYFRDTTATAIGSSVSVSGIYFIKATGPAPTSCVTKYKYGQAIVRIDTANTITKHPNDTTVCEGGTLNLLVTAAGSGPFTYTWKKAAATVGSLRAYNKGSVVATDAGTYTVEVTGKCNTVSSNPASVTINTKPTVTLDPTNGSGCVGSTVGFSVTATGTPTLTYQWRKNGLAIGGATSSTYTIPAIATGDQATGAGQGYDVVVSNGCAPADTSAKATLTVTTNETPAVTLNVDKTVVCTGSTVVLTASGSGGSTQTYAFKRNGTQIGVSGTSTTITTPALTNATESFTVDLVANSSCLASGASNTVTSTAVTVQVDAEPSTPVPGSAKTICTDTYILEGTAPTVGTVSWVPTAPASVTTNNSATSGVTGMTDPKPYIFTMTIKNGVCPDKSATVTITRAGSLTNPNPVVSNNKTICSTTAAPLLTGISPLNSGESAAWAIATGETATVTSAGQTSNLKIGANRFVYTITNTLSGCPADTAVATIFVERDVDAAIAGPDEPTCASDYALKATAVTNGTGTWTPSGSFAGDRTLANATATLVTSSANTFTWTVSNGPGAVCPNKTDQVIITQAGAITSATGISVLSKEICEGDPAPLLNTTMLNPLTANESGVWAATAPAAIAVGGQTSNLAAGDNVFTYTISTTVPGCQPSVGTVTIKVTPKPVATISLPIPVASGTSENYTFRDNPQSLTAVTPGVGYKGQWLADAPMFLPGEDTTAPTIGYSIPAFDETRKVTWNVKDVNQVCPKATATLDIIRKDFTPAVLEADKNICDSPSSNLNIKALRKPQASLEYSEWAVKTGISVISYPNAPLDSSTVNFTAGSGPGIYEFYYSITNKLLGRSTKDSITIRVDGITQLPVLDPLVTTGGSAATPTLICSSSLALPGVATTQTPLGKNWWKVITNGTLPANDSTASPLATGIVTGVGRATYSYKNGVCPVKTVDYFYEKVGDVTPAEVAINGGKAGNVGKQYSSATDSLQKLPARTADTLCLAGNYTLSPRPIKSNESGTWRVVSGTSVSLTTGDLNAPVQQATAVSTGTTVLEWKIVGSVASCNPNQLTMTLVVRDVPKLGRIDGNAFLCQGTDTLYKVNPLSSSDIPTTYTWDAGTKPGALRTGPATGTSTNYKFFSDGALDQPVIKVTPSNKCGAGAVIDTNVVVRLAPSKFAGTDPLNLGDTINGPSQFCSNFPGVGYKLDQPQPHATNYTWFWDGDSIVRRTTHVDTAFIGQRDHWIDPALVDESHMIKVVLTNRCSVAARQDGVTPPEKEETVIVLAPKVISVTLNVKQQFCIPDETVIFDADSVGFPGLQRTYEFFNGGTSLQSGISDKLIALPNTIKDGDVIRVVMYPDLLPKQCVIYNNPEDSKKMEGFDYPNAEIDTNFRQTVICQDNPNGVVLSVDNSKRTYLGNRYDNGTITWTKDGDTLTQYNGSFGPLQLRSIYDGGQYSVTVQGNSAGCASHISKTTIPVDVYIFEKPKVFVGQNPFTVPYLDGLNLSTMPLFVLPYEKDGDKETGRNYYPEIRYLQDPTNPSTLLIPENEEITVPYTFGVQTGNPADNNKGCFTPGFITVIYYLPVNIPNAFTPNGDGLNDTWVIKGLGKYPNTKVKVYNRWGSAMFVDNDGYRAVWDGTHNGQPLPTGTYYYIVELKGSPDGTDENRTGHLTIIR